MSVHFHGKSACEMKKVLFENCCHSGLQECHKLCELVLMITATSLLFEHLFSPLKQVETFVRYSQTQLFVSSNGDVSRGERQW
jgi:hypothetical protein